MRLSSYRHNSKSVDGSLSTFAKGLIGLSLIVTLGFCAICGTILLEMRRGEWRQAAESADNLVAAIESDIARNIELYDLSLQAVVEGIKLPEIDNVGKEIRQLILFDRSATAKDLGSILVLDEKGTVTFDSRLIDPPPRNLATRDYFRVHQRNAGVGLYIGKPFVAETGEYLIGISRRLSKPDGSFAGVVAGAMRLSYFYDLFRKITLPPGSVITLVHEDGVIVMRAPFNIASIGRDLGGTELLQRMKLARSGSYEARGRIDGIERFYTFRRVDDQPLLMVVGMSVDEIFASWRDQAWRIGLMILTLCIITIALAGFLARELKRRAVAEHRLSILANTDGLTGLANRRSFDEVVEYEWQLAIQKRTPLTLLMIDADHFKTYNDSHGHQAGDDALKAIAQCILSNLRRPDDLGTRYGGEEFSVLLPGRTIDEAFLLAERIRMAVAALRTSASERDADMPTVSIGIAAIIPQAGMQPSDLIDAADTALYEAKRLGRNRSQLAQLQSAGARDGVMTPDLQNPNLLDDVKAA